MKYIHLAFILMLSNGAVLADAGIMRLVPVADSFVSENMESANHGTSMTLVIGPQPDQGLKSHIFLRFDISDIPRDAVVSSANLYLFEQEQLGYVSWQMDLHSPQSTWMEEGINWTNKPAVVQMGSDRMDTAEPYKYLDLSSLAQGWIDGSITNNGVKLSATDEDAGTHFTIVFRSREAADCRPYLEIAYTTEERVPRSAPPPSCTPVTNNEPPTIDEITVNPEQPKAEQPFLVEALAKDNNGVYRIELWRDGQRVGVTTDPSIPPQLSVSNPVGTMLAPGRYSYTAFAWDQSMNATAISRDIQVLHDGNPPRLRISHWPREPGIGDTVTFQIDAVDESGIRHVSFTANSFTRNFSLDPAVQNFTSGEIRFDEETLGYSPDSIRIIRYSAAATDTEGFLASTGTGYVVFGNRDADDADSDGVSDEIERLLGTDTASNDTDGDGLYDGWEILGVERSGVYLNLPLWGANPHQKDVFVEIDWMQDQNQNHDKKPPLAALQAITNAFLNHGIHLHFDTGNLGGGNALAYEESCDDEKEKLRQFKLANFAPERLGIFYYVAAMAVVPDDQCWAKTIEGTNIILRNQSVFGYASDLMHELGHALNLGHGGQEWAPAHRLQTIGPNGDIVTEDYIRWTDATLNYKPNYLSVMNYHYQYSLRVCVKPPDLPPCTCVHHLRDAERQLVANPCDDVRPLAYSRWQNELNESALDEMSGFRAPANLGPYVWRREIPDGLDENSYEFVLDRPTLEGWYYIKHHPVDGCCTAQWKACGPNPKTDSVWELADGSPIDWNFNGVTDEDPVEYNLNRYWAGGSSNVCREDIDRTLEASFDSAVLKTQHWAANLAWGLSESLSPDDSPEIMEPTDAEFADGIDNDRDGRIDEGFGDADRDGVADPLDNCPFTKNSNQFDTNENYMGDACERSPNAPKDLQIGKIDGETSLQWASSETENVIGYNVFRKTKGSVDYLRLGISFPTTLGHTFHKNPNCVEGDIYAISSVDLHMKESRLSAGVILSDTDGDAVCDKITRRLSNPYHDDLDSNHLFERWWVYVLIIIVILIVSWIVTTHPYQHKVGQKEPTE